MAPLTAAAYQPEDLERVLREQAEALVTNDPQQLCSVAVERFWIEQNLKVRGLLEWTPEERLSHQISRRCIRPQNGTMVRFNGQLYECRIKDYAMPNGRVLASELQWELAGEGAAHVR